MLPPFGKNCSCQVNVIAVDTGKALKLGGSGDVDVVLVRARPRRPIRRGRLRLNRRDAMDNDFVIV